ncbi:alpha/beta fold hydrolase [Pseudidiomarina insulisalsae]|uniref:Alpha/beta hydrolase n=1 Tax=Pseudidiomarina insulisalsae TaxID=575789 RepID=A0A432YEZ6_9GAMM|nr:alpha/beta hydrolase [Pseudidiomarina insulisalsae]RUO59514.1 alpha/beta hydrolase [Pseudidiomarina insulisalsae]
MTTDLPQGFHRFGQEGAPPVVLLHSSQSNTGQWRELIGRLQDGYDIIGVDLLGYGKAPPAPDAPVEGFRFSDEVPRVVAGVQQLVGEQPMILVGHSYGGALALKLTLERLLPVQALAVFEPVAFHVLNDNEPARQEIESIAMQMDENAPLKSTATFVDYWNHPGFFAALPDKLQQLMAKQAGKVAMDFAALMGEPHKLVDYRRIDVPVLLLTGRHTQQSARRVAEQLHQVLPKVGVKELDCGHMGPLTHPQLVNPHLVSFLARQTEQMDA